MEAEHPMREHSKSVLGERTELVISVGEYVEEFTCGRKDSQHERQSVPTHFAVLRPSHSHSMVH